MAVNVIKKNPAATVHFPYLFGVMMVAVWLGVAVELSGFGFDLSDINAITTKTTTKAPIPTAVSSNIQPKPVTSGPIAGSAWPLSIRDGETADAMNPQAAMINNKNQKNAFM
ncbi:hypothetical protein [Yoonia sp. BS5-3]|uniref:Uncharacterized protein n=1 Tax=Yoonia phaeophyticola TaxID=3137369 RepID=A0ABZ2V032_9RHOB